MAELIGSSELCASPKVAQYSQKPSSYFRKTPRLDLVEMVPTACRSVLDIGCGIGATGELLRSRGARVTGLECEPHAAAEARKRLDEVLCGDAETIVQELPPNAYDCAILGDVLEHFVDPWRFLADLRLCMRRPGYLVISLPNVSYWRVVMSLLICNRWTYAEEGVLDRSHLRFFTRPEMVSLVEGAGYLVEEVVPLLGSRTRPLNRLTLGIFERFLPRQYLLRCVLM